MEVSTTKDDEPCAYAKLWGQLEGKPFHTYVTALPSTLGRGSTATEGAKKPAGFIDLGRSKALSREHGEGEGGVAHFQICRWICVPKTLATFALSQPWSFPTVGHMLR